MPRNFQSEACNTPPRSEIIVESDISGGEETMKTLVIGLLSVVAWRSRFRQPRMPDAVSIFEQFQDRNPCTGNTVTVTFVGTAFVHEHGSREVVTTERTITTSDGFGSGRDTFVQNGQVVMFRQNDVLANSSGDRFLAQVASSSTSSTDTVRVEDFELTRLATQGRASLG